VARQLCLLVPVASLLCWVEWQNEHWCAILFLSLFVSPFVPWAGGRSHHELWVRIRVVVFEVLLGGVWAMGLFCFRVVSKSVRLRVCLHRRLGVVKVA